MAFEDKEAEFGLLLTRMQREPEDRQELYQQLRQKLNELKAYGMPLPEDLVQFEKDLEAELAAQADDAQRRARTDEAEAGFSQEEIPVWRARGVSSHVG